MAKYKVIGQAVEINGETRAIGTELDESEFKPASGVMIPAWKFSDELQKDVQIGEEPEKSELESLLGTGHVEEV